MINDPLAGFLLGLLIGYLLISTLLRIRAVAISIAATVALFILYRFYEGGGNAFDRRGRQGSNAYGRVAGRHRRRARRQAPVECNPFHHAASLIRRIRKRGTKR